MAGEKKNIFIAALFCGMIFLVIMLCAEYRSFVRQGRQLAIVQEQCRTYMKAARSIIEKYGDAGQAELDKQWVIRRDEPVFSVDYDSQCVFVNRDETYLKESALAYLKDQRLESLLNRMQANEWCDEPVPAIVQNKKTNQSSVGLRKNRKIKQVVTPAYRNNKFPLSWPIERSRFWLSSFFGSRKNPNGSWGFHRGIDMAALKGTPVKAAGTGVVVEARYASGYGNTVVVKHNNTYKTRYAHLNTIAVKSGAKVVRGQLLGTVGDTGWVRKVGKDASHLHFEVHALGKQVNPIPFLS